MAEQVDDPVVRPVVFRTTKLEDIVGARGIPPSPGSLESVMADHLVGALDGSAAYVEPTPSG